MVLVKTFKKILYPIISSYIIKATLVEGTLKNSGEQFRIMFIDNSKFMEYLTTKLYNNSPRIPKKWRIFIPLLKRTVRKLSMRFDICIAVLPKQNEIELAEFHIYKSPRHVNQVLNISAPWENIKSRFKSGPKHIERKIRQYGFTYTISKDINDLYAFYHTMWLPLIKKQHGNYASIEAYEEMERIFNKGFLVMVLEGNRAISGMLCIKENDTILFRRIGVLDANEDYIKKGAQTAAYYFGIIYARENGFKMIDFMISSSLVKDGVYNYKYNWGAAVAPYAASEWIYLIFPHLSEKVVNFFENNPVIIHDANGLSCLVGLKENNIAPDELEKNLTKSYFAPGLQGLLLLLADSKTPIKYDFRNYH